MQALPITLRPDEVSTYRAAVIACASPAEQGPCERLLGQLASLEAAASDGFCLAFIPASRGAALAYRALAAMRHDGDARRASRPALHRLADE